MQCHHTGTKSLLSALLLILAGFSVHTGCATFPENTAGNHHNAITCEGLSLEIECTNPDSVVAGQPIVFDLTLKNAGPHPVRLPRNPFFCMKWRYDNGLCDGHLPPDERPYLEDEEQFVTLLRGESYRVSKEVQTRHFAKIRGGIGISEFRAAYHSSYNAHSRSTPFWEGTLLSNTYGVEVVSAAQ